MTKRPAAPTRSRIRRRGFSLVEILVAVTISGVVAASLSQAFVVGIDYGARIDQARVLANEKRVFEERIRNLLRGAYLSADETDPYTYFVASVGGSAAAGGGNTGGGDPDTLTFTATGLSASNPYLHSLDDFETLNETYGPQGGTAEVALSLTPAGDAGDRTGLFLRIQRPADGDPTQGGFEEVLNADVTSFRLEFFDGQQWVPDWDSGVAGEHRLPAAIHVFYTLGDDTAENSFVVRLPLSDVTPDNPAGAGGGGL